MADRIKILNSPSVRRMPSYLHKLMLMHADGEKNASATKLAEYMDLDTIIVRKDFELTGITGRPGVGYRTDELIEAIRRFLGWDIDCDACLVGAGSLGSALLGYEEFAEYGLKITHVFDADPKKIGTYIHGHKVLDIRRLHDELSGCAPAVAVICVPSHSAQNVADELVSCGVKAFWSFANVCLQVPADIIVQREVIAGGFAMLSMKLTHRGIKGSAETGVNPANPDKTSGNKDS